jgi:hypothetical protein
MEGRRSALCGGGVLWCFSWWEKLYFQASSFRLATATPISSFSQLNGPAEPEPPGAGGWQPRRLTELEPGPAYWESGRSSAGRERPGGARVCCQCGGLAAWPGPVVDSDSGPGTSLAPESE